MTETRSPREIAEAAMPGWRAVDENPADGPADLGPGSYDTRTPSLAALRAKYGMPPMPNLPDPEAAPDVHTVVMAPADSPGSRRRMRVVVSGGTVVAMQG